MESNHISYNYVDSSGRIQEVLNSAETFEEVDYIPPRSRLTYSNGFYVNCTALFIDIRGSSKLPETHTRPVLGKIYRAYLSECVAVINGDNNCSEIFINGDCVSGILNTPYKNNIDEAFDTAAKLCSIVDILNWNLERKGYKQIQCGVGLAYGRALMLKAGYNGSKINDVIWMGDVVNEASKLCHQGNRDGREPLQVSSTVYGNLSADNQKLLSPVPNALYATHHEGRVFNIAMNNWLSEQKESAKNAAVYKLGLLGGLNIPPNWP